MLPNRNPDSFEVSIEKRKEIALMLLAKHYIPSASTNITDEINYGYGMLDDYGFWEFPLEDYNAS